MCTALVACADFGGFHLGTDLGTTAPNAPVEDPTDGGASSSSADVDGATGGPTPDGSGPPSPSDAGPAPTGYAAIVLADAPLAYWRLDESTGTTFMEAVKGRNGTLVGKATLGTVGAVSDGNPSVTLGATPSRIDVGDHFDFDFDNGKPFTFEAWVKAKASSDVVAFLVKATPGNGTPGSAAGWLFGLYQNVPTISIDGAYLDGPAALPVSRFSHVVATSTGTTLSMFVDGTNVVTAAIPSAGSATPGQTLSLGGWSRGGSTAAAMQGALDEVAIYDKVLSPARIAAHAAAKR